MGLLSWWWELIWLLLGLILCGVVFSALARWAQERHRELRNELSRHHPKAAVDDLMRELPRKSVSGFFFGSLSQRQERVLQIVIGCVIALVLSVLVGISVALLS